MVFYRMVYGRQPAGIVLHVVWCRYYFVYFQPGKKSGWFMAGRLFLTPPIMVAGVWLVQCIYTALVLGYFISICYCWHHHVCIPPLIPQGINYWCGYFAAANDSKGKCK